MKENLVPLTDFDRSTWRIRSRSLRLPLALLGIVGLLLLAGHPKSREYLQVHNFAQFEADEPAWPNAPVNVTINPPVDPITGRANATLLVLARNSELSGVEVAMRELETSFNHEYNYPWTFLNEVPFTYEFKEKVRNLTRSEVRFAMISNEEWYPPVWIDEGKYDHDLKEMESNHPKVPYVGSMSYRNMCRFNSGYFFRQPVLDQFKWYWRVEPKVRFPCKIPFDPFAFMIEQNKRYAFSITLPEHRPTIPTLWDHTKSFIAENEELFPENNSWSFLTNNNGESYNGCHFWSNFEIGDLDFFRSDSYMSYFEHLDKAGGFYYERWGDAPVHSIALSLLLPKDQIHYFDDLGYFHSPYYACPRGVKNTELQCSCKPEQTFDSHGSYCQRRWFDLFNISVPSGY